MYSLYFITLQRSGTRPVTKPLRSIRPEHRGTFHTQFWLGTIYIYYQYFIVIHHCWLMTIHQILLLDLHCGWAITMIPIIIIIQNSYCRCLNPTIPLNPCNLTLVHHVSDGLKPPGPLGFHLGQPVLGLQAIVNDGAKFALFLLFCLCLSPCSVDSWWFHIVILTNSRENWCVLISLPSGNQTGLLQNHP